jgi:NAD(P)-dependent dehydrogenase (short-subunit alcohol dehydrogenase family)
MHEFTNRVAVITGAASGIGKGIATQLAKEGMKLVLADIEERPLVEVEKELQAAGAHTLAVMTDVSKRDSVFALADRAFATFGAVHVLCNKDGRFYIVADPARTKRFVRLRMEGILNDTGPSPEAGL